MKSLLERAVTLNAFKAQEQMALYCYLSNCCTLSAKEVEDKYNENILNKTCVSDLYASIIVDNHNEEELASLFLEGSELYSNMIADIFSAPVAATM